MPPRRARVVGLWRGIFRVENGGWEFCWNKFGGHVGVYMQNEGYIAFGNDLLTILLDTEFFHADRRFYGGFLLTRVFTLLYTSGWYYIAGSIKNLSNMKSLEQIKKQQPVYLHNWKGKIGVISDFEDVHITDEEFYAEKSPYPNVAAWHERKNKMNALITKWGDINILFASYGEDNYSGDAFVLFEQDGVLYEINASHCSCYGVEGQWNPEEVRLESLALRLNQGTMGTDTYSDNEFANELKLFLGID